jgi:uridine kinase
MKLGPGEPPVERWKVIPVADFVRLVYVGDRINRPWILTVDGRSGSGKSTAANLIQQSVLDSSVVHTDDIAWHYSFFDWSDLLIDHILKPLHSGLAVSYRPPGWEKKGRLGAIEIASDRKLVIVEGVGANRVEASPWIDSSVWVQSDLDEAERRGIARDGGTDEARRFWKEWMAQEYDFLQRQKPWDERPLL